MFSKVASSESPAKRKGEVSYVKMGARGGKRRRLSKDKCTLCNNVITASSYLSPSLVL